MNKKNILLNIIFILLLTAFNTLYRYIIFTESLTNYFNISSFGNAFATTSNVNPPYLKIFLFSFTCTIFIEILLLFCLFFINKRKIKKSIIFNDLSNFLPLSISIIISSGLLFINKLFSYISLILGIIIYLYFTYKRIDDKKSFMVILFFIIIMIYLLYLISS